MKTLLMSLLFLLSLTCENLNASFEIEKNAFISLHESVEGELNAYIIYEGHEYVAPVVEHYIYCRCLKN